MPPTPTPKPADNVVQPVQSAPVPAPEPVHVPTPPPQADPNYGKGGAWKTDPETGQLVPDK